MMQEAMEERGHRRGVAEQLAPVVHEPIGRQQRRRPFVAAHDQLEDRRATQAPRALDLNQLALQRVAVLDRTDIADAVGLQVAEECSQNRSKYGSDAVIPDPPTACN